MAKITGAQINKMNAAMSNGWTLDIQTLIMWGDKTASQRTEPDENGVLFEATLRYTEEREGTGWTAKPTGRQLVNLTVKRLVPAGTNTDYNHAMYRVEYIGDKNIGEPQSRRMFSYIQKLTASLDFAEIIAEAKGETEPETIEEQEAPQTINDSDPVAIGAQFEEQDGTRHTVTALDDMHIELDNGGMSMYDFGTRRTVADVMTSIGNGAKCVYNPAQEEAQEVEPEAIPEESNEEPEEVAETRYNVIYTDTDGNRTETATNRTKEEAERIAEFENGNPATCGTWTAEPEATEAGKVAELLDAFQEEYNRLYDHAGEPETDEETREAAARFGDIPWAFSRTLYAFTQARGDAITSDREAAAYILALDRIQGKTAETNLPENPEQVETVEPEAVAEVAETHPETIPETVAPSDLFATLAAAYINGTTAPKPEKAQEPEEPTAPDYSKAEQIGIYKGVEVWDAPNGLTVETLQTISDADGGKSARAYVITAPVMYLADTQTEKYNISFLKYRRDIDENEIRTATAADLVNLAGIETTPGYTGEASGALTPEEVQTLEAGGQVRKDTEGHRLFFTATPYTEKTSLVYSHSVWLYRGDENRDPLEPGESLSYAGFITGGKFYRSGAGEIVAELNADIERALREAIPDEKTAERNAETVEDWERGRIESAKAYDYTDTARRAYYSGKTPALQLYHTHGNKPHEAEIIRYMERPAEVVTEYATAYAKSHRAEILQAYIAHNRTAEAYRAILDNPDDEAHTLKAISESVTDQKTARILLSNGETVKTEASQIKGIIHGGSIWAHWIDNADRGKLPKGEDGRPRDITAADIVAIIHGTRTLYRATA